MNILLKIHDSSDDYDFVKVMVHLNFFFSFSFHNFSVNEL